MISTLTSSFLTPGAGQRKSMASRRVRRRPRARRPQRGSSLRIAVPELRALSKFRREKAAAEPEAIEEPVHLLRDPAHGRETAHFRSPIRGKRRASSTGRERVVRGPLPAAPLHARLIILARTLLRGPSALLGRYRVLRNFRALLLALTAGLACCLTIFTHNNSPAKTSRLTHAKARGRRIKLGRFPGPPISSLRLTFAVLGGR